MLSFVVAFLSSMTLLLSNFFVDERKDPRQFRIGQEQFEQPRS